MLRLFYKNNGAISVFLSLVLLPVMIVAGMTTDAARVYMSKVVISDAGEMAMNAGLAQYNEALHDEYGLLVMNKTPESMSGDLEGFFNASLNGTGISGTADYQKILDLLTENFQAIGVAGSEIYKTDVEKQQILEYMKYRAPVCIAELVLDKLGELKETKKMMEAMEAEMDFSEAMEDCQDAFEEAKQALDALDTALNSFLNEHPQQEIEDNLHRAHEELTKTVAMCLLMRAAIQNYTEKSSSTDLKSMAENFKEQAKKVNLSGSEVYSKATYDNYIGSLYYKNTVESLGGIDKLLSDYDRNHSEEEESEEENSEDSGNDEEREKLEDLVEEYKQQKSRIADYPQTLLAVANNLVNVNYNTLHGYWMKAKEIKDLSETAYGKLGTVREKLKDAADKFEVWDTKTTELGDKAGEMKTEVQNYRRFFSSGEGGELLESLDILMRNVETDKLYFTELRDILTEEKFFGMSIATTAPSTQMNRYNSEAKFMVSGQSPYYDSLDYVRTSSYITDYHHISITTSNRAIRITDDEFYLKLQEYCDQREAADSQQQQQQANERMESSKEASEAAKKEDDYPDYDWSSAGVTLPSTMTGANSSDAKDELTNLDVEGNVKSKKARRNVIAKFKESIQAATSFLDAVDRIVEKNLEGLYIAEYAMQMGSYYTVNKEDGQEKVSDDIITISGYKLEKHKAYRAECEYVLWGKNSSKTNIRYTVMTIFGIRLLFNSFFAFTNGRINNVAEVAALAITGAAPYLKPIVKVVIKLGFAGVETANDIQKIKEGYGVTILKSTSSWATYPFSRDNTSGVTLDYSEYLRIFLNMILLSGGEEAILGRIGDLIQVNTETDITKDCYTMLSVQATVKTRTTFLHKASEWSGGGWDLGDSYSVSYQSVLGY